MPRRAIVIYSDDDDGGHYQDWGGDYDRGEDDGGWLIGDCADDDGRHDHNVDLRSGWDLYFGSDGADEVWLAWVCGQFYFVGLALILNFDLWDRDFGDGY